MAAFLGAEVLHVTIEPDHDDGPRRDGDAAVRWHHRGMSKKELAQRELMAVLAGPIAEMIHREVDVAIDRRREWAADWALAMQLAEATGCDRRQFPAMIQMMTQKLRAMMGRNDFWQAIAEVADLLDAHETIEGDDVNECVARWLER